MASKWKYILSGNEADQIGSLSQAATAKYNQAAPLQSDALSSLNSATSSASDLSRGIDTGKRAEQAAADAAGVNALSEKQRVSDLMLLRPSRQMTDMQKRGLTGISESQYQSRPVTNSAYASVYAPDLSGVNVAGVPAVPEYSYATLPYNNGRTLNENITNTPGYSPEYVSSALSDLGGYDIPEEQLSQWQAQKSELDATAEAASKLAGVVKSKASSDTATAEKLSQETSQRDDLTDTQSEYYSAPTGSQNKATSQYWADTISDQSMQVAVSPEVIAAGPKSVSPLGYFTAAKTSPVGTGQLTKEELLQRLLSSMNADRTRGYLPQPGQV
jgi:hypothetical protein